MSRTTLNIIKGVAALAILAILLLTVNNWWGDYRRAADAAVDGTATKTVTPTKPQKGSGGSSKTASATSKPSQPDLVVVLIDGLNFRVKPEAKAKVIRGLNRGERLVLLKKQGEWLLVQSAEGDEGWISSSPTYTRIQKR